MNEAEALQAMEAAKAAYLAARDADAAAQQHAVETRVAHEAAHAAYFEAVQALAAVRAGKDPAAFLASLL